MSASFIDRAIRPRHTAKYMYIGTLPGRKDVINKFLTFLTVEETEGRTHFKWVSDRDLARNIKFYQERDEEFLLLCQQKNEKSLVQHFLAIGKSDSKSLNEKSLARKHIAAYLETPRYRAAIDRFKAYRDFNSPQDTWEHYLWIAGCATSDLDKVSEIFQRHNSEQHNLSDHFHLELASYIRDEYYKDTGQGKYSPWCNLNRASERKLKKGLQIMGLGELEISRYIVARDCLFEVYSKHGKRWLEPTVAQFQLAANYYNLYYCTTDAPELSDNRPINGEKFKTWMKACIRALQASPIIYYIESYEDNTLMPPLNSPDNLSKDPLLGVEEQEEAKTRKLQADQIKAVLLNQLQKFDDRDKKMLRLRGVGKNQTQVAKEIGINQATVARGYQRCERQLLRATAEWVKNNLGISLTITVELEEYIAEWLKCHYKANE